MKVASSETRIVEVRYDATFNLGNYENEKIGLTAQVGQGDSASDVLLHLKAVAHGKSNGAVQAPPQAETQQAAQPSELEPKVESPKPKKEKKAKETEPKAEETKEAPAEEKKTRKAAGTPYQRSLDLHKKLLGQLLDSAHPSWRTNVPLKEQCVAASQAMEGKEFLDGEGMVLESFKTDILAKIKA